MSGLTTKAHGSAGGCLVEGPTLADPIAQGAIPIDEAHPIAKQIAEALEAAHETGVIHRGLKPANIKVRDDGTVKLLDTIPGGDRLQSLALTAAVTQMGVIMGRRRTCRRSSHVEGRSIRDLTFGRSGMSPLRC